MPKTYTAAGTVAAGDVYTAAAHNIIATDVNNLIVPPTVGVKLTSGKSPYVSGTSISWDAEDGWDTDSMWTSGANITLNTAGIYLVTFNGVISGTSAFTYVVPTIDASTGEDRQTVAAQLVSGDHRWAMSSIYSFAAAATVSFNVGFVGGGTTTLNGTGTAGERNRASVTWIGTTS